MYYFLAFEFLSCDIINSYFNLGDEKYMTQSYFEAYAYKRFKNADVIFTKSVTMDDSNLEVPINSYVNVKPSILQPDSGSKIIDAMKDAKSSVYFKADVAFPTDRKSVVWERV